ncbi:hypothetical protein HPB51_007026 [Rhipicephalus microplus]|uniref:M13 family peptidase n=1 Tax=Rhipicephalus microplus TaxID=6941 RepID=A0A9J6DZR2_RHIMP|nr:hypothetical protein HPB51_007026 [Rhipicephalus microplus]
MQSVRASHAGACAAEGSQVKFSRVVTVALVIIVTPLLSLLIPLLHYLFSRDTTPPKTIAFCSTPDCAAFGHKVSLAINAAIDPCHDFHGFVCGGWKESTLRPSTEARMITDAYDMAIKEVKNDAQRASKAAQFFGSCMSAGKHKNENLERFAELRKVLSLTWPESKPRGVQPLDVMVNMALNWRMNFLFDMGAVAVRQSTALLFTRGRLDMGWEERVHNKPQHGKYEDYVDAHYGILEVNASRRNINASELLNLEQAILNAKLAFLHDAPQQDWFNLSALDTKTSSLPPGLWLNILRKHDRQFNWTNDDIAIAEDVKIFQSIDKLHKTNGNDKLIIGLSWIFIQTHLWAVTGEPSLRFSEKQDELQTFWERSCMAYVESRLGLLVLPKSFTDYYAEIEHRNYIDSLLKRMRDNAKQLLNNLTWMDGPSKMLAFRKLENMTRVILPAEIFFDRKTRDKLYGLFPEMTGKTFVTNLVETTEIYRKLRRDEHFGDVYSVHLFPQFGLELYLYLANALTLAIGVLNPPLFYKNATLAMRYGGMASFAARGMVKSFDEIGVRVNEEGQRGLWLTPASASAHEKKSRCDVRASANASSWRPLSVFPFIPGIELAYVSYEAAVGGGYLDLLDYRVIHLEPYSDDQIFFIAYCYALCAHRPQTMADECNVPVKNSPQFAAAYHCPVGSPMNPPNKCTFFY